MVSHYTYYLNKIYYLKYYKLSAQVIRVENVVATPALKLLGFLSNFKIKLLGFLSNFRRDFAQDITCGELSFQIG